MLRGDAPREAPPPTVHNTVVSFGSGQFYTDRSAEAAIEPPRQGDRVFRSICVAEPSGFL